MQHLAAFSLAVFAAVPALAHPSHVAEESGHTHWLALAAVGAAVAVGIAGYMRGTLARRRAASAETK